MPTIDRAAALDLARRWCAAWNSHDLEQVYALYADDFEMRSPLIIERGFSPTGALRGKNAIRPYWGPGIATAQPPLRFELVDAYGGVDTVAVHYRSLGRKVVVEVLELDPATGLIVRGGALHGDDA
jgi:ketosteroid isomerase-like protein|nr:nuclear transport factor 2 family protein [Kofleriaceae bacterium]